MKVFVVVALCVALSEGNAIPGATISNQNSKVVTGDRGTGISHGGSTATGGPGGAIASQDSKAIGGDESTVVADGSADATAQGGFGGLGGAQDLLSKYGLGGGVDGHGKLGGGHGGGFGGISGGHGGGLGGISGGNGGGLGGHGGGLSGTELGPAAAVSNQNSHVRTGAGGTGISNGAANSQGGLGGALAHQSSKSEGGDESTVVAEGQATSSTLRKRSTPDVSVYLPPGGVRDRSSHRGHQQGDAAAVSNQKSEINAGHSSGTTGIAHGISTAEGGRGGALSNQISTIAALGRDNTLVADGESHASTVPKYQTRETRRNHQHGPGAPAIATQTSRADAGNFGEADARGKAKANSAGGLARADQQSTATAGLGGRAKASGSAEANSFPVYKRAVDTPVDAAKSTGDLISDVINKTAADSAKKIATNSDALIVSSAVSATNN